MVELGTRLPECGMVGNMSDQQKDELDEMLRDRLNVQTAIPPERLAMIPIDERAEAREFIRMPIGDQLLSLYTDGREAKQMIREIRDRGSTWKVALVNASATIVAVGAVLVASMSGKIPQ